MARIITTEYQKQAVYADVEMSLEKQSDGDITRDIDVEAIKNSLMNIISTVPGERRMLPEFAFGAHRLLFEPMDKDTASKLGYSIIEAIQTWDDRINIEEVKVNADYDNGKYDVVVDFSLKGFGSQAVYSVETILRAQ